MIEERPTSTTPRTALDAVHAVCADPSRLRLVAQPVVDLDGATVAGWEALARVPDHWGIGPDVLFAAARRHGLSGPLEAIVVRQALALLDTLPPNTFLTVNVDPVDLEAPAVVELLLGRDSLARLVLEVTEHAWPQDREHVDRTLAAVRERGALVAADDIGAGYAGLTQLMRLRPQIVKLDRELIVDLGRDPAAEAMVRALGHLCGSLDAWVVAEGVETVEQLATLSRLEVPLAQGWLLGRPSEPWSGQDLPPVLAPRVPGAELVLGALAVPVPHPRRDHLGRYLDATDDAPVVTFAPTTGLRDAIDRALARREDQRWTPLLVTDARGVAVGEVPLETLVLAALDEPSRPAD